MMTPRSSQAKQATGGISDCAWCIAGFFSKETCFCADKITVGVPIEKDICAYHLFEHLCENFLTDELQQAIEDGVTRFRSVSGVVAYCDPLNRDVKAIPKYVRDEAWAEFRDWTH